MVSRAGCECGFPVRVSGGSGGHRERSEQAVPLNNIGAYSSVWLERTPDKREVGGSNPPRPTIAREASETRGDDANQKVQLN